MVTLHVTFFLSALYPLYYNSSDNNKILPPLFFFSLSIYHYHSFLLPASPPPQNKNKTKQNKKEEIMEVVVQQRRISIKKEPTQQKIPPLVAIPNRSNQKYSDVPSAGDHLYEIRKRPDRDSKALQSVVMVLKQEKEGKPLSVNAKRNRERMKTLRKKGILPQVAKLRKQQRNLRHAMQSLNKIQESATKKAEIEATQGNDEKKKARGGIANQAKAALKASERIIAVADYYASEYEKMELVLTNQIKESKNIQNHFEILTESVLAWGKNVIHWAPPNAWELERLPVTLYQLRVHNEMDDPAEKFSTDKKKKAKARAKRKRREQAANARAAVVAIKEEPKGITQTIQIVKPRLKKQKII